MTRLLSIYIITFSLFSFQVKAQIEEVKIFSNTISAEDLQKHVEILASDSLEGRKIGEIGQKKAANYLASFYSKNNIKPFYPDNSDGYFQHF